MFKQISLGNDKTTMGSIFKRKYISIQFNNQDRHIYEEKFRLIDLFHTTIVSYGTISYLFDINIFQKEIA
jgi:hypothetical protein